MEAIIGGDSVSQTLNIDTYSQWYGAADGYSFCSASYDLELSGPIPQWMGVTNGNLVTIGAASPQHEEDSFDLALAIKREGLPDIVRYFNSELKCTPGDPCDFSSASAGTRTPEILSTTEPRCENYIQGTVLDNSYEDVWYVPRRPYMLTKVEMWKDRGTTTGFKVTYTLTSDGSFVGWPEEETHMFGFEDLSSHYAEVELTRDLQ